MMWRPPSFTTRSCSGWVTLLASTHAFSRASSGASAGSSPFFVQGGNLGADRLELLPLRLVDHVREVYAGHRLIGGNDRDVELVDLGELVGLRRRRTRHARELVVHPEVVLKCNSRKCLIFRLDPD